MCHKGSSCGDAGTGVAHAQVSDKAGTITVLLRTLRVVNVSECHLCGVG